MDNDLRRIVRRQQTLDGVTALRTGIAGWLKDRRTLDRNADKTYVGRHKTQLESLESVLGGAAEALVKDCGRIKTRDDAHTVYRRCYELDEAAAWLRRLWLFYKDKFDQREDPRLGATLHAADEIVWSTYHQVMGATEVKKARFPHGPAPLVYVAAEYSPAAIPSSSPLGYELRVPIDFKTWDEELKRITSKLAIPLLWLPDWNVRAPWWLIFVAHEIGHHINDRLGLTTHFEGVISGAVARATCSAILGTTWRQWTEEILADAWSLVFIGPAAAAALADVILGVVDDPRAAWGEYPPAVIRLALMDRLASRLRLDAPHMPAVLSLATHQHDPVVVPHLDAIDAVARALGTALPKKLGTLQKLAAFSTRGTQGAAKTWSTTLLAKTRAPTATLGAARQVVAGSFVAWQHLLRQSTTMEDYQEQATALADHALAVLGTCGPDGTRTAFQPPGAIPDVGQALADRLLALSKHDMLPSQASASAS